MSTIIWVQNLNFYTAAPLRVQNEGNWEKKEGCYMSEKKYYEHHNFVEDLAPGRKGRRGSLPL
jgi:hypothetical protein